MIHTKNWPPLLKIGTLRAKGVKQAKDPFVYILRGKYGQNSTPLFLPSFSLFTGLGLLMAKHCSEDDTCQKLASYVENWDFESKGRKNGKRPVCIYKERQKWSK